MLLARPTRPDDRDVQSFHVEVVAATALWTVWRENFAQFKRATGAWLQVDLHSLSFQLAALAFRFENFLLKRRRTRRFPPPFSFAARGLSGAPLFVSLFNRIEQSLARKCAILRLGPRVLHGDTRPAWPVPQCYCRCHLVHVLPAGPAGPRECLLQVNLPHTKSRHPRRDRISHHLIDSINRILLDSIGNHPLLNPMWTLSCSSQTARCFRARVEVRAPSRLVRPEICPHAGYNSHRANCRAHQRVSRSSRNLRLRKS